MCSGSHVVVVVFFKAFESDIVRIKKYMYDVYVRHTNTIIRNDNMCIATKVVNTRAPSSTPNIGEDQTVSRFGGKERVQMYFLLQI